MNQKANDIGEVHTFTTSSSLKSFSIVSRPDLPVIITRD